jgi:acyl-CoA reductase-like NAD-dependent aldehyde dehydrogenase
VSPEHDIWHEEVFGPLTVAVAFDDEDDAIAKANDCQFGLAASIWTADVGRSWRVAQMLDIGVVWINDHHRIDPASPWGGTKDSGLGSENGWEAYRGYTHPQSIVVNTSRQPFDWFATTEDLRYS